MNKSIQQFQVNGVKRLTDIFVDYSNDFSKQAEMINGVKDVVLKLGRDIIKEEWEFYDELLRRRKDLRKGWPTKILCYRGFLFFINPHFLVLS